MAKHTNKVKTYSVVDSLLTRLLSVSLGRFFDHLCIKVIYLSIDAVFSRSLKMKYMGSTVLINTTLKDSWAMDYSDIDSYAEKFLFAATRLIDAYNLKCRRLKKPLSDSNYLKNNTSTLDRDVNFLYK